MFLSDKLSACTSVNLNTSWSIRNEFEEKERSNVTSMHEDERCQNHKCYSTRYSTIESLLDVNVRGYFSSQMHVINSALYDSRVTTIKSLTSTRHLTIIIHSKILSTTIHSVKQDISYKNSKLTLYNFVVFAFFVVFISSLLYRRHSHCHWLKYWKKATSAQKLKTSISYSNNYTLIIKNEIMSNFL